jgi:hypothetical protein
VSNTDNITPGNIDQDFPVAGQDNDTQGFRENFTVIKDSLTGAAGYIATLQDETAKTNTANNFQGNNILNANLVQVSDEAQVTAVPNTASTKILDFEQAAYYDLTFEINTTISFTNFPGDSSDTKHGKMVVILRKATTAATDPQITFDVGTNTLRNDGSTIFQNVELTDVNFHEMFEIRSLDNTNFYISHIGSFS